MTDTSVGRLWQYPVKSMQGKEVDEILLGPSGVAGDRAYGFVDVETGRVGQRESTPSDFGALLDCHARFLTRPPAAAATPDRGHLPRRRCGPDRRGRRRRTDAARIGVPGSADALRGRRPRRPRICGPGPSARAGHQHAAATGRRPSRREVGAAADAAQHPGRRRRPIRDGGRLAGLRRASRRAGRRASRPADAALRDDDIGPAGAAEGRCRC